MAGEGAAKSRVERLANFTDVLSLYYLFDVALVPLAATSLFEVALPLKAIELAALDRNIVAADYRQMQEFFTGYPLVEFYRPGSAHSLAEAVGQAFGHDRPEAFASLARVKGWTWESRGRELEKCLAEARGNR